MKKCLSSFAIGLTVLSLVPWAHAANNWYPTTPANMRIVQLDTPNTNNPRMYVGSNAIQSAIDNCATMPNLSATNRCLVKIMPGVYSVATAITMKAYVDVEGSGDDSLVTSAIAIDRDDALWATGSGIGPGNGTIIVPAVITDAVTIRNAKIANTSNAGGVAILAKGKLRLENVTARASGNTGSSTEKDYCAVAAEGSSADVLIQGGSYSVENASSYSGHAVGVGAFRLGRLSVVGATIAAVGSDWCAAVASLGSQMSPPGAAVEVRASSLSSTPTSGGEVVQCDSGPEGYLRVLGSRLEVKGTSPSAGVLDGNIFISNSELHGNWISPYNNRGGLIGASMVDTVIDDVNTKLVNCWDTSFNPIANQ